MDSKTSLLSETWQAFSSSTQQALKRRVAKYYTFCAAQDIAPLPVEAHVLYDYVRYLKATGTIQVASVPVYLSALSSLQRWLGFEHYSVQDPTVELLLKAWRQGLPDESQDTQPVCFPPELLLEMIDAAVDSCMDDIAFIRGTTALALAFVFMGRSDSSAKIYPTDIHLELGTGQHSPAKITFQERRFKGKRVRSGMFRTRTFYCGGVPAIATLVGKWQATHCLLYGADAPNKLLFVLPAEPYPTAWGPTFGRWFSYCLAFRPWSSLRPWLTPHSLRRGSATLAWASGVDLERVRYWGGWSFSSKAVLAYLDFSAGSSPAGVAFFGWLVRAELFTGTALPDAPRKRLTMGIT